MTVCVDADMQHQPQQRETSGWARDVFTTRVPELQRRHVRRRACKWKVEVIPFIIMIMLVISRGQPRRTRRESMFVRAGNQAIIHHPQSCVQLCALYSVHHAMLDAYSVAAEHNHLPLAVLASRARTTETNGQADANGAWDDASSSRAYVQAT